MSEVSKQSVVPRYMEQLLEELGWNQGTRIPLASAENRVAEELLVSRQHEIQRLKEALIVAGQKQKDLDKYKNEIQSEHQENTRLLFALKSQLEQEVKLRQDAVTDADRIEREVAACNKKIKDITDRIERFQKHIARQLKRADALKTEVCGERGALQEWRGAIERSAGDITAIEQFTKQDVSKAKELEYKRQLMKVEHDRMHERLQQLVCNLAAEERACERISVQVMEGLDQRKQMMELWASSVENLRQRDTDIKHMREDYAVLEAEATLLAEQCREQQAFCEQQSGNNAEAARDNGAVALKLGQVRIAVRNEAYTNLTMDSEVRGQRRVLDNVQQRLEKKRAENRQVMEEQRRRDRQARELGDKIDALKEKVEASMDKTKSAEKRVKELEEMLNEEEQFATALSQNQQRIMHCSFREQQKLVNLKNEEKLVKIGLKASRAILGKMDGKEKVFEKNLRLNKEAIYKLGYQVETVGAKILHMEGASVDRNFNAELAAKENRLKEVHARHAARVSLLERHSMKLHEDMHRLSRELEAKRVQHEELQSKIKMSLLTVEGSRKDYLALQRAWRKERVEEALTRLRVAHATRAVAGYEDTAFTLDAQRLQLDAAMNERMVEIEARRDMFSVQRRALQEDCGKLRSEIREREQRIDQLIKRYDIFIGSLGKDDQDQQVSVTYFKIKFAAERAELRMRGIELDKEIVKREKDVAAMEATLQVIAAAHAHFVHHIKPLADDTPEIQEIEDLMKQYYALRDELKPLRPEIAELEQRVNDASATLNLLSDKNKQLTAREAEAEVELENARDRLSRQETRLNNAKEVVRHFARRAKKLVEGIDEWRIFQMALWVRDYAEAAGNALAALDELTAAAPEARAHLAALVASTDVQRHVPRAQRRLITTIERILSDGAVIRKESCSEVEGSVFSKSSESICSGVSQASGHTRRLSGFRKTLAQRVQEPQVSDEIPEVARRSTVSLRVVTLGIESSLPTVCESAGIVRRSRRSLR